MASSSSSQKKNKIHNIHPSLLSQVQWRVRVQASDPDWKEFKHTMRVSCRIPGRDLPDDAWLIRYYFKNKESKQKGFPGYRFIRKNTTSKKLAKSVVSSACDDKQCKCNFCHLDSKLTIQVTKEENGEIVPLKDAEIQDGWIYYYRIMNRETKKEEILTCNCSKCTFRSSLEKDSIPEMEWLNSAKVEKDEKEWITGKTAFCQMVLKSFKNVEDLGKNAPKTQDLLVRIVTPELKGGYNFEGIFIPIQHTQKLELLAAYLSTFWNQTITKDQLRIHQKPATELDIVDGVSIAWQEK